MDGTEYLGTVIIRHRLTPALERASGHIGYHVVPGQRRRGHATQMLAQAMAVCHKLGLREVLVTCPVDNLGSRRVIEANGGSLTGSSMARPTTGSSPHSRTPEPRPLRRRPMSDEAEIRALIERWAEAVHAGDMDGVLAGHADDIVMFDVPPPEDGVRGIRAYYETWPPFFEWQRKGATFEIVSLEVTAGADVAFAHALLRCGTVEQLKQDPDNRLRLTIGLRKEGGRWVVAHEHHSFPDKSQA